MVGGHNYTPQFLKEMLDDLKAALWLGVGVGVGEGVGLGLGLGFGLG